MVRTEKLSVWMDISPNNLSAEELASLSVRMRCVLTKLDW